MDLIDRIYEAAVVPENWPDILSSLANLTEAEGGLLFSARDRIFSWTATENLHDTFETYVVDGWFKRCGRRVCMMDKAHAGFLGEQHYWSEAEIAQNEIYRDFFRPRNLGWSAGTGLVMPTGDQIVMSVERSQDRGPLETPFIDQLNELRPHLARSAMISARLGLKGATTAKDTLEKLGVPTILINARGESIDMGEFDPSVMELVVQGHKNRVGFTDPAANTFMSDALLMLNTPAANPVQSFAVRDETGNAKLVAHLIPVSRSARDIFAQSFALLTLIPLDARKLAQADLLRSLFDLTASEARVARQLALGKTIDDIAAAGNVSTNTVRTQLRKVMEKTGCSRQAEVVSLLMNISLPG